MTIIYHIGDLEFDSTNLEDLKQELSMYYSHKGISPSVEIMGEYIRVDIDDEKISSAENLVEKAYESANSGDVSSAKNYLQKAISMCPLHADAHRTLAQILMQEGKTDEAISECSEAIKCEPDNLWALILMGNLRLRKGSMSDAFKYYNRAIELHPDNPIAINNIGGLMLRMKNYDKALDLFNKALGKNEGQANAHMGKIMCLSEMGRLDDAFEAARMGCLHAKDTPENPGIREELKKLIISIAQKIVSDKDGYNDVLSEEVAYIRKEYGVPTEFVADNTLNVLGKLNYWKHHNLEKNIVFYNDGKPYTPHYVMHELMHLELYSENTKEGVGKILVSSPDTEERFMKRFNHMLIPLNKRLGGGKFQQFKHRLYSGLCSRAMNSPIDLFVEDLLFEKYPQLRPLQLLSLVNQEYDNSAADKEARSQKEIPLIIVEASRIMNLVQALQLKNLYGLDFIGAHNPSKPELNKANSLFLEYQAYKDTYKPGDEYELFEYFIQTLRLQGLMDLKSEDSLFIDNPDHLNFESLITKTREEEKLEQQFQEAHKDGEDPTITFVMSMYMLNALEELIPLEKNKVKAIAYDIAMLGMGGISPTKKSGYTIPSLPGKDFGGYQMLAWYYVSWSIAVPEMVDQLNLPFSKAYDTALSMYRSKRPGHGDK